MMLNLPSLVSKSVHPNPPLLPPRFVGLDNYAAVLASGRFWGSIWTTAVIVFVSVALQYVIGLVLALALHHNVKGASLYRVTFLLPMFLAPVCVALIARMIFHPVLGPLNDGLTLLGAANIPFLTSPGLAVGVLISVEVWQWTPFVVLLMLAGLQGLPSEVFGLVAEFGSLWTVPDFAIAVVALLLLTVVGVTSIVAAKRKLGYEVWHAIHLATYVAVGLSIPHQFSMSGLFADGTWQRWYWLGLYGATAFALLAFRVLLPLISTVRHGLVVSRVVREAHDVVSVEMTGRHLPELDVQAGQFLHWRFLADGLWWHQHPFSVSAAPTATTLRITVRNLGAGTARLMDVRPGTRVMIEGPYGIFSDQVRTTDAVTLVGIGIGIAPIRAVLEATDIVPGRATVILRSSTPEELYLVREVEALCRAKGARLITLVGHRAVRRNGTAAWVPASHAGLTLADMVPYLTRSDVYVCGPQAAADLVIDDALAAGVPAAAIHNERFSW